MHRDQENILTKRFQTTMIGALFQFEESFGYLWGQDKDDEDLTENEKKFRFKWEDARNQILNNGNSQLRKCISDINRTYQPKYKYNFYKKGQDQ